MTPADHTALVPAAALFGRLLVRELDAAALTELQTPAVQEALAAAGVQLPPHGDLDELASSWLAAVLHPNGWLPPVQSVWVHGQFDGDTSVAVRVLATTAGLEPAAGARGTPVDQIGCLLLLWAELAATAPDLAEGVRRDHLAWGLRALAPMAHAGGFYGQVAEATRGLLRELTGAGA